MLVRILQQYYSTFDKRLSTLCRFTKTEITLYFENYIEGLTDELKMDTNVVLDQVQIFYDGYNFGGVERIFNPFSLTSLKHLGRSLGDFSGNSSDISIRFVMKGM